MRDKLDESVARDTAELVRQEKVADADATPATYVRPLGHLIPVLRLILL